MMVIQTKFGPGQRVFLMHNNKPFVSEIVCVIIESRRNKTNISYYVRDLDYSIGEDSISLSLDGLKKKVFG